VEVWKKFDKHLLDKQHNDCSNNRIKIVAKAFRKTSLLEYSEKKFKKSKAF
jgi:hypothetical protein